MRQTKKIGIFIGAFLGVFLWIVLLWSGIAFLAQDNQEPAENPTGTVVTREVPEGEESTLATYEVEEGVVNFSSEEDIDAEERENYEKIWKEVVPLFPPEFLDKITKYQIITDGKDGLLAFVEKQWPADNWTLGIDSTDSIQEDGSFHKDFKGTVVHEIAHIIALESGQMDSEAQGTYTVEEGRLKEEAYLNQYYQKFWSSMDSSYDEEHPERYYRGHPDEFVSEYAATNPVEDFAETFLYFVEEDRPTGNTIRDQKILFMYEYPQLVEYRKSMREQL